MSTSNNTRGQFPNTTASKELAAMIEKEFIVQIDHNQLDEWLKANWPLVSALAHAINDNADIQRP